ncbi:TPA: hypothetical protein N0F65_002200, partial [Lagenidium giganteum]
AADAHVQVAVRCRPLNEREKEAGRPPILQCKPNTNEISINLKRKTYGFDKVFGQYSTQKDVFRASVKPAVDEALAGYNCTVFAYGQTGTGKTYTMQGDLSPEKEGAGIIPRSVRYIFDSLQSTQQEYSVKVSFLQLYNEELKDLLAPDANKKLRLMEDVKRGGIYCQNLLEVTTTTASHVFQLLETGVKNRITSETLMNENSSRSHSIFTIRIHSKESNTAGEDLLKIGQLNLVDLAGSECVGRSGARNIRAREAGNINQSLLTLGRVITALVDNHPHVPYRDSKLTRLLQESLGGRAKTTIIATLAPCADSIDETMSTLDYAYRARSIKNKPEVNQKMTKHALLKEYGSEIESLRTALQAARQKDGIYLPPAQFTEMQERLAGQAVQLSELEDELESRTKAVKELEDAMEVKTQEMEELQEKNAKVEAKLGETTEQLEQTQQELESTTSQLRKTEDELEKYKQNEHVLLRNGAKAKSLFLESERRIEQLLAKIERSQSVAQANNELAASYSNQTFDQIDEYRNRLKVHQEKQESMFQEVVGSVDQLKEAHDSELAKAIELLGEVSALVDANKEQRASLMDEEIELRKQQQTSMGDLIVSRGETNSTKLRDLIQLSQQHAAKAALELEASRERYLLFQKDILCTVAQSRVEMEKFTAAQETQLQSLQASVAKAVADQVTEIANTKAQLMNEIASANAAQDAHVDQFKTMLEDFFSTMKAKQAEHSKKHQQLIESSAESHCSSLRNVGTVVDGELASTTKRTGEWKTHNNQATAEMETRLVDFSEAMKSLTSNGIERGNNHAQERTLALEQVLLDESNHQNAVTKMLEEQRTAANELFRRRSANENEYAAHHAQLSNNLAQGCASRRTLLDSSTSTMKRKLSVAASTSLEMVKEGDMESQNQRTELEQYLKKRKLDDATGNTPQKQAVDFPLFEPTSLAPVRRRTSSTASRESSQSTQSSSSGSDENVADSSVSAVPTSSLVPPKRYRALSNSSLPLSDSTNHSNVVAPTGRQRHLMAVLCLCVTVVCYADRTNIGIAIPAFVHEKDEQGRVLSSFFYGYLITQVLGSLVASKIGAKRVLIAGVLCWTLFDLSTILVYKCATCLFLARAGMGLGEGIVFPCLHQIAAAWFPLHERSRSMALVSSGNDLGTILALVLSPVIMGAWGWQYIFVVFGCLSVCWIIMFAILAASTPGEHPRITPDERQFISRHTRTTTAHDHDSMRSLNWRVLLLSRPAWGVYVAHFCFNYSWYVLLGWVPQYFSDKLHVNLHTDAYLAAIPYVCGYLGVLVFGVLGDHLVAQGVRVVSVRRLMNAVAFFASAVFLFLLRYASSATTAVGLLSLTLFCGRACVGGFQISMIDIAPHHAGHVMGVSNTIATIPGIVGNVVTGHILHSSGDWDFIFAIASTILALGGVVFHICACDRDIYPSASVDEKGLVQVGDRAAV